MVDFTHVLYPTDLSPASLPALRFAGAVADAYAARMTVLHVVPTFDPIVVPSDHIAAPNPVAYPPAPDEVLGEMQRVVRGEPLDDIDVTFVPLAGDPAHVIVDRARADAARLIVMGTHGHSGITRLVVGSVTETVLQTAPCPVLTVPPHVPAAAAPDGTFKRILCAVDLSPASQHLLGVAVDLAQRASGAVTAVHVCEIEDEPRLYPHISEVRQQVLHEGRNRLNALVAAAPQTPDDLEEIVALGDAGREILRIAEDEATDLVVMGAQTRRGVRLALLGSTTQHVVRAAKCPVLVVRSPEVST